MTIGMRLPPNRIDGKWVAASKPQALGMVANDKVRLNTYNPKDLVMVQLLLDLCHPQAALEAATRD